MTVPVNSCTIARGERWRHQHTHFVVIITWANPERVAYYYEERSGRAYQASTPLKFFVVNFAKVLS